eukprot:gene38762-50938_t
MSLAGSPSFSDEFVYSKVLLPYTRDGAVGFPLDFVPDFQLDDAGQIVWDHVAFSFGAVEMTARVPCAPGLMFPLGWVLLSEAAGVRLTGGGVRGWVLFSPLTGDFRGGALRCGLGTFRIRKHVGFCGACYPCTT